MQDSTNLTLTDDTDLNLLEVGDAVTSAPVTAEFTDINVYALYDQYGIPGTSPLTSTTEAAELGEQNYFNNNINDSNKLGNRGLYIYDTNSLTVQLTPVLLLATL